MVKARGTSPIAESRYVWGVSVVLALFVICGVRLWYLQIYQGSNYARIAEFNHLRQVDVEAPRGAMFDRSRQRILGNRPFFDLVYIPQYVENSAETLRVLSRILGVPVFTLQRRLHAAAGGPKYQPLTLYKNLSEEQVAAIETNKVFLPGVDIQVAPRRDYRQRTVPAHVVGYLGEISSPQLKQLQVSGQSSSYRMGDLVGKHGLEEEWEAYLRGVRGSEFVQVDALGRQTHAGRSGLLRAGVPPRPGAHLFLTLDQRLQEVAAAAFAGKNGAVVVMDPRSGEILAMVSAPDFNPQIYQTGMSVDRWHSLISNPFKPLFDKTVGGLYAPGSVYKPVVALAALSEGLVSPERTFHCSGRMDLGKDKFHCHNRTGHGEVSMQTSLVLSCDVYYYNVGLELGGDTIARYARDLGLGRTYEVRLNREQAGLIPNSAWLRDTRNRGWMLGEVPNIAIGQGYNLMTPLQIAVLYAAIANGGRVYRPFLVRRIENSTGQTLLEQQPQLLHRSELIRPAHFARMRAMLGAVVHHPQGTGRRALIAGHTVAGKTGSVQVVGLGKHRNRKDTSVSMRWQEHAMFAAFSPIENAEIVVAVVSQNDPEGGGGVAAAPIARQIIDAYWRLQQGAVPVGALARSQQLSPQEVMR